MVQVVVGEQRGEGVRMGCRTFWDTDTDAYASDTFINVSDEEEVDLDDDSAGPP